MTPLFSRLIIDGRALEDPMTIRIRERLAGAVEILSGDDEIFSGDERVGPDEGTLYLRSHMGRFVKDFPVTPGAPPCGEKYIAALQGCTYGCSYCYLRSYLEGRAVTVLIGSGRMEDEIRSVVKAGTVRLTTGELGDSLALDHITGLTSAILPLLEGSSAVLEARTKSAEVDHLPGIGGGDGRMDRLARRHLLVTWTLSPGEAIEREEPRSASLEERLGAISKVSAAGIGYALRLDPIIPHYWDGSSYGDMLEAVRSTAATGPRRIELGVLRFPPGLLEKVREDSPFSPILQGEYIRDREGKIRLYRPLRVGIYREAAGLAREVFPDTPLELSQEDRTVWEDAGIEPPAGSRSH